MKINVIVRRVFVGLLRVMLLITGCGQITASRSASGAGLSAAAGGAIGSLTGNFGAGELIGGGAGAVAGYLYDQHKKGNID
jgi:hypothetical protein